MRVAGLVLVVAIAGHASVLGVSTAAPSLTEARVRAELPAAEQRPWLEYLRRSQHQMAADKAALAAERTGTKELPTQAKEGNSARAIPLHAEAAFYKSAEARQLGDAILSFQTPAGGWSKNLALVAPRARGEGYTTNNLSRYLGEDDFDAPKDPNWNYVGTLDNDATNTELRYLALLSAAWPGHEGDAYRASFIRGIEYLLAAQYPNGGWPQVWPLEGGYHDAITFNDDAVTESAETLTLAAGGGRWPVVSEPPTQPTVVPAARTVYADYSFVPEDVRFQARLAVGRALQCILKTQQRVGGVLTVWSQQVDPLTLQPVSGRNFEPAALSSGESASVMEYLMAVPNPSPEVVRAVESAAAWFEAHKIMGYTWSGGRTTPGGRKLTAVAGAGPLWARYYSLGDSAHGGGKPVFGDRDKTIHDDVMELSLERRNGYAWYSNGPERVLAEVPGWKKSLGKN
jgi:hypothetical protein